MLKPAENIDAGHILEVNILGYSDMIALATNLIKLCAFAVHMEGPYVSDLVKNRHIDIGTVLEHALQLFPYAEIEVLDEIISYSSMMQRIATKEVSKGNNYNLKKTKSWKQ